MIHGVSKHTTNAVAALDYFLDGDYYEEESGTWKPREPAPELLEGDPVQMRALCDSLSYKHKYVSAVLSFSKEETEHINATPGMKEALIEELRDFVYAGFKNDDAKAMVVVQHSHLDRMELHYMVPRVNLESGLSFTPFPVRYDDTPPGSKNLFIEQNNAFVDHVCEKYGLQNPRDPSVERAYRPPNFEKHAENKNIRKTVVSSLNELIDCGKVKSRDDMTDFLKSHGAEITRQGKDYFSFKFPEMKQAIKLKGELYGEQSFEQIAKNFEQRKENFEASRDSAEGRYASVNDRRAEEIEERHGKRRDEAERASDIDPGAERELRETASTLEEKLDSLGSDIRAVAADGIREHPGLMKAPAMAGGGGGGKSQTIAAGSGEVAAETSVGTTGDAVLDQLISSFHNWLVSMAKKRAAAVAAQFDGYKSPATNKGIANFFKAFTQMVSFRASVVTGHNLVEPSRGRLNLDDMKLYRKALSEQLKEARFELKEIERAHKAENQVTRVKEPMAIAETLKKASSAGLSYNSDALKKAVETWKEEQQKEGRPRRKHDDPGYEGK